MPKRKRPLDTTRSEHWLRKLINNNEDIINKFLIDNKIINKNDIVEWLSPVLSDKFNEYYDKEFLDRLNIDNTKLKVPLNEFWPISGPRWDGLGKTNTDKYFLIEAKAYIEESVDYSTGANSKTSIELINKSINQTKDFYSDNEKSFWQKPFYQYSNRLAHLYYLNELNHLDAYLIFIYFYNAPDVCNLITSKAEWVGHIRTIEKVFALNSKCKNKVNIFIDVNDLK